METTPLNPAKARARLAVDLSARGGAEGMWERRVLLRPSANGQGVDWGATAHFDGTMALKDLIDTLAHNQNAGVPPEGRRDASARPATWD